jgi:CheY-like chemotaxis protein
VLRGKLNVGHPTLNDGTLLNLSRIAPMSKSRVLIVEDEYLVAADLEAALEELGYASVGIAQDLETALDLAQAGPDIALVDVHLRDGETGPLIARRLVEEFAVKVLFVTANPRMVADTQLPGAIGVIGKPCQHELIAAALEYALVSEDAVTLPAPPVGLTLLGRAA